MAQALEPNRPGMFLADGWRSVPLSFETLRIGLVMRLMIAARWERVKVARGNLVIASQAVVPWAWMLCRWKTAEWW